MWRDFRRAKIQFNSGGNSLIQLEIGTILDGKISGVMDFGAFVTFGDKGQSGLVHISEISNEYVADIRQHVSVGQEVKVKIVSIADNGKIALSIRQTQEGATAERFSKPARSSGPARGGSRPPRVPRAPRPAPVPFDPSNPPMEFTPPSGKSSANPTGGFEDKMLRFKQDSEEKIHALKRGDSGGKRRKSN